MYEQWLWLHFFHAKWTNHRNARRKKPPTFQKWWLTRCEMIIIVSCICRRETGPLFIYVKRLWVSSFQGLALNMLRIGLWRPVLTTFWPIVRETPLWDPRHSFFPLFLLIWLPRHIYLGFSLHFYRGKFNNGYIYIYIARQCHTRGHKTILFRHSIFILLEGRFLKLVL